MVGGPLREAGPFTSVARIPSLSYSMLHPVVLLIPTLLFGGFVVHHHRETAIKFLQSYNDKAHCPRILQPSSLVSRLRCYNTTWSVDDLLSCTTMEFAPTLNTTQVRQMSFLNTLCTGPNSLFSETLNVTGQYCNDNVRDPIVYSTLQGNNVNPFHVQGCWSEISKRPITVAEWSSGALQLTTFRIIWSHGDAFTAIPSLTLWILLLLLYSSLVAE